MQFLSFQYFPFFSLSLLESCSHSCVDQFKVQTKLPGIIPFFFFFFFSHLLQWSFGTNYQQSGAHLQHFVKPKPFHSLSMRKKAQGSTALLHRFYAPVLNAFLEMTQHTFTFAFFMGLWVKIQFLQ